MSKRRHIPQHPVFTRRTAVQAGAIGILGLGMNHLPALQEMADAAPSRRRPKSVIYIFLSGGLSQHESFDMKPEAPDNVRGEFRPIATRTPGVQISQHLPMLAQRSEKWALLRSMTHPHNEHSDGHHAMLTGRSPMPRGFDRNKPKPTDYPCLASIAGAVLERRGNLPPAVVLPEKLVHRTGRTIPGQFGAQMGSQHDPWFIQSSRFMPTMYGAFPTHAFQRRTGGTQLDDYQFEIPSFSLPEGVLKPRLNKRLDLLGMIEKQRQKLDQSAGDYDRHRQHAVSLLMQGGVRRALDVHAADGRLQDRYGRNSFGWSLLMARQLVEEGVRLVQVNLGNNETWDTHEAMFHNLRNYLFPPTDQAVSALIDDLDMRGLLDDTLIVMASEFGRTPRIFNIPKAPLPGRDHWGAVQTIFFAGGGVKGGQAIGASDKRGGYPALDPQRPENLAATIYETLGLPKTVAWHDQLNRPHYIYHGSPIPKLMG